MTLSPLVVGIELQIDIQSTNIFDRLQHVHGPIVGVLVYLENCFVYMRCFIPTNISKCIITYFNTAHVLFKIKTIAHRIIIFLSVSVITFDVMNRLRSYIAQNVQNYHKKHICWPYVASMIFDGYSDQKRK